MGVDIKVAIASTGLGHISRGIETWAKDTADALATCGIDVTLFSGAPLSPVSCRQQQAIRCIHRQTTLSRFIVRCMPGFCWRWGLKDGYGLEQFTFWQNLLPHLKSEGYDILHVQDPMLARWCQRARRKQCHRTKVILGHGTEESPQFLSGFDYVQHLAPYHLQEVQRARNAICENWVAIPNFVDTERFRPAQDLAEKLAIRRRLEIPEDAFVVLSVAALKTTHKRIDYLIREVAALVDHNVYLIAAGGRERTTGELMQLAGSLLGSRARLQVNLDRECIPELLRAADVFALCSLKEMMPIALLEAISTGLPALVNHHPVLEWMIGTDNGEGGGLALDLNREGALTNALLECMQNRALCAQMGQRARAHALKMFSKEAIIRHYIDYYEIVQKL